jgi:CRISPR-associated protein Cas1
LISLKRIIAVEKPAQLKLAHRQLIMTLTEDRKEYSIPIEDILVLMISSPHTTLTSGLARVLAEENVSVIFCSDNYHPVALCQPLHGHTLHSKRIKLQVEGKETTRKQAWQQIVTAKIKNQGRLLQMIGKESLLLNKYGERVLSDDKENCEAKAAKVYWNVLFEGEFTRHRFGHWPNSALNYTYAVFRSVMARAVVGSGLATAIGIHHRNQYNSFCLVDDLIEPYRPFADQLVLGLLNEKNLVEEMAENDLSREIRQYLLSGLQMTVKMKSKEYLLGNAMELSADSYVKILEGRSKNMVFPMIE